VHLAVVPVFTGARDAAWVLYERAFDDLRAVAVQRHVMYRAEFDGVLADDRIAKYVVTGTDGGLVALATMTNDLEAVPLISPEFFEHRWPVLYAKKRVWYVPFVAVDPRHQAAGVMQRIIDAMCLEPAGDEGGVICLDVCEYRETSQKLPMAIEGQANRSTPGITRVRLDAQVFWGYEFPTPA
jgi:hypothetical protein